MKTNSPTIQQSVLNFSNTYRIYTTNVSSHFYYSARTRNAGIYISNLQHSSQPINCHSNPHDTPTYMTYGRTHDLRMTLWIINSTILSQSIATQPLPPQRRVPAPSSPPPPLVRSSGAGVPVRKRYFIDRTPRVASIPGRQLPVACRTLRTATAFDEKPSDQDLDTFNQLLREDTITCFTPAEVRMQYSM